MDSQVEIENNMIVYLSCLSCLFNKHIVIPNIESQK